MHAGVHFHDFKSVPSVAVCKPRYGTDLPYLGLTTATYNTEAVMPA